MFPTARTACCAGANLVALCALTFSTAATAFAQSSVSDSEVLERLAQSNVVWNSPSEDASGSMPLGNGDIALNAWVERDGSLVFYIAKTDAWSENGRLLKVGRVRVRLTPNPFAQADRFQQTLALASGEIVVRGEKGEDTATLRLWVDANHPVVCLDYESTAPLTAEAELELWRTERRQPTPAEGGSFYGQAGSPTAIYIEPDTVIEDDSPRLVWFHRNERSIWRQNLELQALGGWCDDHADPLLHRTFGGMIEGQGMERAGPNRIASTVPQSTGHLRVHVLTSQAATQDEWIAQLSQQAAAVDALAAGTQRQEHERWWHDFWLRSWIHATGNDQAEAVTRGYNLQRFQNACAGRGAMPIKFNGSLFTVDAELGGAHVDADYRGWGPGYWFQNTRFTYWSTLAAGDTDLAAPFYRMYRDTLPLAQYRSETYYGHAGAFWPETIYFWGTYVGDNYGWDRAGKPDGLTDNGYIRYHWEGGIELVAMMLEQYDITRDDLFLQQTLLPLADSIVTFYGEHYRRDEAGRLFIAPAQALETYWDSVNPTPEIAGLQSVLPRLLALPGEFVSPAQRETWEQLLADLPPLPTRQAGGESILGFAERVGPKRNSENPELYPIFPFGLYGVGRAELEMARSSYHHRVHKSTGCWRQDPIQAAMLGITHDAATMTTSNFLGADPGSRFPGFWGKGSDWIPDQDNGGVAMVALQRMVLQSHGDELYVLPAWPADWNVSFKLHAPDRTIVTGDYENGRLATLDISPAVRAADVVIVPSSPLAETLVSQTADP